MRKLLLLALVAGMLLSSRIALSCNSKEECIIAGEKAYQSKHYEQAKEYFKKAIQLDPKCEKAWKLYDRALKRMLMKELSEDEGC